MIVTPGPTRGLNSIKVTDGFQGDVWIDMVLPPVDGIAVNETTFMPGAKTDWHNHQNGQLLRIVLGEGYVCQQGQQPVTVRAGDTVWCQPGETHWHGATDSTTMVHTAVTLGETSWLGSVAEGGDARQTSEAAAFTPKRQGKRRLAAGSRDDG